ncbi:GYD domain-containing protein [Roseateles oligotrophus]|uniref:GYD domain-containing protein n=1 Tax=Roseateles oligotrophus TaxID=1769250 RepID=A0ABT2YF62_9BURK|nr:GYD domain-containing protein [Roseateles oligotrophus]MCV2368691.1 GYD domain-containing protein [Roseateles oligotrophus]
MPHFILLTRLTPESLQQTKSIKTLEHRVVDQLQSHCPEVVWLSSYALLGPWDYLDVFEAPDITVATRVAVLVRSYGQAHAEIWPAMAWPDFKSMLDELPKHQGSWAARRALMVRHIPVRDPQAD